MNRWQIKLDLALIGKRFTTSVIIVFVLIGLNTMTASAGSLTPPGPPTTPTMRSLEQLKPTWDKTIPVATRFVNTLDRDPIAGAYWAALDKETGLVWEQIPASGTYTWLAAMKHCYELNLGGRNGWRLPTVDELNSLIDMSNPDTVKLPVGQNIFVNVQSGNYWSSDTVSLSTSDAALYGGVTNTAWAVHMGGSPMFFYAKTLDQHAWCARGGR